MSKKKTISNADFLKIELENGIGFHNPSFVTLASETIKQIKELPIKSVLDYGAGTGVYSQAYLNEGYEVFAFELFKEHKDYINLNAPNVSLIDKPITTDLLNFIETAEHMTNAQLNKLMNSISPKYILFSSTSQRVPEFDEQWGHINVKEQSEWDLFFEKFGYKKTKDLPYPTSWSKLYTKV
jgi:hypothetical protein